jgi:hypothetical protein
MVLSGGDGEFNALTEELSAMQEQDGKRPLPDDSANHGGGITDFSPTIDDLLILAFDINILRSITYSLARWST